MQTTRMSQPSLRWTLWAFCVLYLMGPSPSKCETYRSTDPFAGAIPLLDNDDYTSDNPFEKPCTEAKRGLVGLPCTCSSGPDNGTYINCDRMVFPGDFPVLPYRYRIHGFSQRMTGYQAFPAQLFTASDIPLKKLDLSQNGVVLITEKLLDGIGDTLEDINLSRNLLGDQLNPIFSTNEFQNLKQLKRLDLSDNDLKAIDDAIIKGCEKLQEFRLERNSLTRVPSGTLKEPKTLQRLHLEYNNIGAIGNEAFVHQASLRTLNLSHNVIANIDMSAFKGLSQLQRLDLSYNKISRLSERLFQDVSTLQDIDLSNNFLSSVPTSLTGLSSMKRLSLSANLIQNLDSGTLGELSSLEYLDLSRNNIADLPNGTLSRISRLKTLQFSVNTLRKVEDDAFRGLDQLEELYLDDNGMLAIPHTALRHAVKLRRLSLSFNRIAVVSGQLFVSIVDLQHLSLSYNVIRELPEDAFLPIKSLRRLELRGNQLTSVQASTFRSLASSLQELDLGRNRINSESLETLDLPQVQTLRLDHNNLTALKRGQFAKMTQLNLLNCSHNSIDLVPSGIFRGLYRLRVIDLRSNNLATLAVGIFDGLANLRAVYLQDNLIQLIDSRTFNQLPQMRLLQLARNQIAEIRSNAFENLPQLRKIVLAHNLLDNVPRSLSRISNATIPVEVLDLTANKLTNINAEDLFYWNKLEYVSLARNKIATIDERAFRQQSALKTLDLSRNMLKVLPAQLVSQSAKLRAFDVSHNLLENVSSTAFQNSTQLQSINLSFNRLRSLPVQLFTGITRLHLNLERNKLSSLPGAIFDRTKIHGLLSIHLGHNLFEEVPVDALQRQFFYLDHLNMTSNQLRIIPADTNILVTIKTLDLSFNPLTEESIHYVLSEPKKVKDLNMAGTGISKIPVLETPFLRRLNLSSNKMDHLNESVFMRPTLLEVLDLSNNEIAGGGALSTIWSRVIFLKKLLLSSNPLTQIVKGDLSNLASLESLELVNLPSCTKLDSQAFSSLPSLRILKLYGFPRLESLPSRAILQHISTLERVDIEITEPTLQDQLAPAFLPRIRELHVHGRGGLRSISPATLAGMTSPKVRFALHDTAISNLPASLLFPVPMSTELILDLSGTKLSVISPQFLAAADNHRQFLELRGLRENPIVCDCNARPFRRWLKAHVPQKGFRSRRRPRQIQADSSSAILVRVSASSVIGRSPITNITTPVSTASSIGTSSDANDLVAFKFVTPEVSTTTTPPPTQQQQQSGWNPWNGSTSEQSKPTVPEGEVFVVTIGYDDSQGENNIHSSSHDASAELQADDMESSSVASELVEVRCSNPTALLGMRLIDIAEEDLSCDGLGRGEVVVPSIESETSLKDSLEHIDVVVAARPSRPFFTPTYSPTLPPLTSFSTNNSTAENEPDIIWYNEDLQTVNDHNPRANLVNKEKDRRFPEHKHGKADTVRTESAATGSPPGLHHMDAVIIGIVGGVVAFVALLIIIICLVRLRSAAPYRGGPMAGALALRHDKCTCVGPASGHPMLCHCLPGYPGHALHGPPSLQSLPALPLPLPPRAASIYSMPLPRKMSPPQHHPRSTLSLGLTSRSSFYPPTPYYVTFPPEERD